MSDNAKKNITITDGGLASDKRNIWWIQVHESDAFEDVLSATSLWPFCKRHDVRVNDKIEVVHPLRAFFAELLVDRIDEGTQSVRVIVVHRAIRGQSEESGTVDLSSAIVEGPIGDDLYRVRQGRNVLSRGHETSADANEWLEKEKARIVNTSTPKPEPKPRAKAKQKAA